jgi:hypothetical protein
MNRALALAIAFVGVAVFPAAGAEELVATTTIGTRDYFAIRDGAACSVWLKLGESFHGRTLTHYDRETETLELKVGDAVTLLRLPGGHVQVGPAGLIPGVPFELVSGSALQLGQKVVYSADAVVKQGSVVLRAAEGQLSTTAEAPKARHGNVYVLNPNGVVIASPAETSTAPGLLKDTTVTWRPLHLP